MISENQGGEDLFLKNGFSNQQIVILDSESEATQPQSQQLPPVIKKNKAPQVRQIKQLLMIDENVQDEPQELRGYEWIQSTNEEEMEVMKNICYLEQYLDLYDDLDQKELIHLDIPQFINYMGNSGSESSSIISDDEELDDLFEDNRINQNDNVIGADFTKPLKQNINDEGFIRPIENGVEVQSQQIQTSQVGVDEQQASNNKNNGNLKLKGRNLMSQSSIESSKEDDIYSQINQQGRAKRYQSSLAMLAQEQFIRISKYGDVALTANIARRNPKSDDFYDQDDPFIDDDQVDTELKQLAICEADYDDFFMVEGGLRELVKSIAFKDRLKDIQEYRDTKKLEIHLRSEKKEEKPKQKGKNKQTSKSQKADSEKPKGKSLIDNDEDDEKLDKKKKKNPPKNKSKIDNLHLKQPTFKEDEIEETSQNKKMQAEDKEGNSMEQQNQKNIRKSNQKKEQDKQEEIAKSTNINQNQLQKEQNIKTKQNKKNSIQKQDEAKNKLKEVILIPQLQQKEIEQSVIIIDEDEKSSNADKKEKKESIVVVKKLSIQAKNPNKELEKTPKQERESSDKKNVKSFISINLSSSKKINENSNSNNIPINIVKKQQSKDSISLDGQEKYAKTRSQKNDQKANGKDNEPLNNLFEVSKINRGRDSNRSVATKQQSSKNNNEEYINELLGKPKAKKSKSISAINSRLSSSDNITLQEKQIENLQNISAKRSLSLVNSNKLFLDEQPLNFRNSSGQDANQNNQKGKRKIINPKKEDRTSKGNICDEKPNRQSNTSNCNQQKSDKNQSQPAPSQNSNEVMQTIKKKIIKTDKRKREKDISEEAQILVLKQDKRAKE